MFALRSMCWSETHLIENAILLVLSIWTRREMGVKYCEFTTRVRQINRFIQTAICFSLDLRTFRTLNGYFIVMRRGIVSNFKPSLWGSTVSLLYGTNL